jgi:anti-sigma factor RsiW
MSARQFTANDIHLALDGELPADERAEFGRWLEAHPDMQALSARFERDRTALAEALAFVLDEPVPPKLTALARGEIRPRRSWSGLLRAAAAAVVLLAIGGTGGYLVAQVGDDSGTDIEERFVDNAIVAFRTYAADQPHSVEVAGNDKLYLENWLSKRVGVNVVAPDLAADGFTLLGGRVLPAGHEAAALLVYQDTAKNQLSIYMIGPGQTEAKAKGVYTAEDNGPTAIYWLDPRYGCAIVGAMSQDRLSEVAKSAWDQMKQSVQS